MTLWIFSYPAWITTYESLPTKEDSQYRQGIETRDKNQHQPAEGAA